MEIVQILDVISTLIENARPNPEMRYHICWWNDEFRFLPACHTSNLHPIFLCHRGAYFTNGLLTKEWDTLLYKIIDFQKGLSQCHEPQKQLPTSKPKNCLPESAAQETS